MRQAIDHAKDYGKKDVLGYFYLLALCCMASLTACRGELPLLHTEDENTGIITPSGSITGFYLLNEGNMGSNKASLDYYDYASGTYQRNIYPERNPEVVKELGDVGNDLAIYGSKLYAVINCSHYVEVMDARTARHLGSIDIQNCRFIAFANGKAYVSSYAGPVQMDPQARPGKVVEIDTLTLKPTREVVVGYQPEEMAVAGNRLFVANSGGYRAPNYDHTISVIDLQSFQVEHTIEVAPNLHHVAMDQHGTLYVSSQGDYNATPAAIYTVDSHTLQVTGKLDLGATAMCLQGDSLFLIQAPFNEATGAATYTLFDLKQQKVLKTNFISDGTDAQIRRPYGMAVNPVTREIFVTDAGDYITPGTLYCFTPQGERKWQVTTGDIPATIAFTTTAVSNEGGDGNLPDPENPDAFPNMVFDYRPAPGQFTNAMPAYEDGDGQVTMNSKVLQAIGMGNKGLVTLGGFGGYVEVGFSRPIENVAGYCDFRILGNALNVTRSTATGTAAEPGIIEVAADLNGNGRPDADEWCEIAGSAHAGVKESWMELVQAAGGDIRLIPDYAVTYHRPTEPQGTESIEQYIYWTDNQGQTGYLPRNNFHSQPYYPQWIEADKLTLHGTRLPQNGINESSQPDTEYFVLYPFSYGYADNYPNDHAGTAIDIDWAVDKDGKAANLSQIDFIRIYSGMHQVNGWVGESSTEVGRIENLHLLGEKIETSTVKLK